MENIKPIIVFTTFPDKKSARKVCSMLIEKKFAACVQYFRIDSIYKWKGKIENAKEIMCLIKTEKRLFHKIEKAITEIHSYEVPEIISVEVSSISKPYKEWLIAN